MVLDGPFTETKEVIGGYSILEAQSKAEAVELTRRFLKVHGTDWDVECEVREFDGPDFACKPRRRQSRHACYSRCWAGRISLTFGSH